MLERGEAVKKRIIYIGRVAVENPRPVFAAETVEGAKQFGKTATASPVAPVGRHILGDDVKLAHAGGK